MQLAAGKPSLLLLTALWHLNNMGMLLQSLFRSYPLLPEL